jgi:hypothetical protein
MVIAVRRAGLRSLFPPRPLGRGRSDEERHPEICGRVFYSPPGVPPRLPSDPELPAGVVELVSGRGYSGEAGPRFPANGGAEPLTGRRLRARHHGSLRLEDPQRVRPLPHRERGRPCGGPRQVGECGTVEPRYRQGGPTADGHRTGTVTTMTRLNSEPRTRSQAAISLCLGVGGLGRSRTADTRIFRAQPPLGAMGANGTQRDSSQEKVRITGHRSDG